MTDQNKKIKDLISSRTQKNPVLTFGFDLVKENINLPCSIIKIKTRKIVSKR